MDTFQSGKVAVFGASGLVGQCLVELLIKEPSCNMVTVFCRSPLTVQHKKVEQRICKDLFQVDFETFDGVFCSLGTTITKAGSQELFFKVDHDLVLKIAGICMERHCSYFGLVSAIGADARSKVFYNRTKGKLEDAISQLGIPRLCIVRPSLLLGNRTEQRIGEKIGIVLSKLIQPLLRGRLAKYCPVDAEAVAMCLVNEWKKNSQGRQILEWNSDGRFKQV